jgi:hypothetical protein
MSSPETGWPMLDWYSAWLRSAQTMLPGAGSDIGGAVLAPRVLTQPINPGWIFGNVSITNDNSGDPEAERRILEAVSYGRQLGRLMDVVAVLVARAGQAGLTPEEERVFKEFREVEAKIKAVKAKAESRWLSEDGMTDLANKLKELKTTDPETYARLTKILRSALATSAGRAT